MSKKKIQPAKPTATTSVNKQPQGESFFDRLETKTNWHIAIIILLPFLIYARVIGFEFIDFDDKAIILDNHYKLADYKNFFELFRTDAFLSRKGNSFYRPIQNASFMLDAIIGGREPSIYHLSNLLIHILTCISLYGCFCILGFQKFTAFIFSTLYAVHPLFASAVSWVPARGDLLIGLEGILLLMSFIRYQATGKWQFLLAHAFLFFLAVFTKETAVLFPALLLLYHFFILKKKIDRQLLLCAVCWALIFLGYFLLRKAVMQQAKYPAEVFGINPFFKNLPAIPITAGKVFIPANLSTMPLFDGSAMVLGLLTLGLLLFISVKQALQKNFMPLWGLCWFFLLSATPLFYRLGFAQYKYTYFEFRTYLPIAGLLFSICFLSKGFLEKNSKRLLLPFVLIAIVFSTLSYGHSSDYRNTFNFFNAAVKYNNPGAYMLRGISYADDKKFDEAGADFDTTILLAPDFLDAYLNRGKLSLEGRNDYKKAEEDFSKVINEYGMTINTDSTLSNAYINRSITRKFLQNYQGAMEDLKKARQLTPNNAEIDYRLGNLYSSQKKYMEAIGCFDKAINLRNDYTEAYNNRATVFYFIHDFANAEKDYKKAIALDPDYTNAYSSLGSLYLEINKPNEAIACFDNVIRLSPGNTDVYYKKGKALQLKNDVAGACSVWKEALQHGNSSIKDTIAKYCK